MRKHYILGSVLGLVSILGCGQKEAVETPSEMQSGTWEPPRDVPIETTDHYGFRLRIYRGTKGSMQTYKVGDDCNPIICGSKKDFEYFAEKGEYAIYSNP